MEKEKFSYYFVSFTQILLDDMILGMYSNVFSLGR